MLAVTGVVVNDSLVLLTRYNDLRTRDTFIQDSLLKAGTSCFRAIVLTTLTTVCGLMPLLKETYEQAQYLIPAAISLAWGELVATPATLFIVPVLTHISHDGLAFFRRLIGNNKLLYHKDTNAENTLTVS
jgi:multidrug efflux pump subunit AcrB